MCQLRVIGSEIFEACDKNGHQRRLFGIHVVAREDRYRGKGFGTFLVDAAEPRLFFYEFRTLKTASLWPRS